MKAREADMKSRVLLAAFGFPLTLLGAWVSWQVPRRLFVNQSECFAYPCTPPNTRAFLALALGALIAGLVMLGLAATGMKTRARLTALGFPLSLFGAWASWLLLRGIIEQTAGICEIPCVTVLTVPLVVLALGGSVAGLVMLGLAVHLALADVQVG